MESDDRRGRKRPFSSRQLHISFMTETSSSCRRRPFTAPSAARPTPAIRQRHKQQSPIDGPVSRGNSISSQSMCRVHVPSINSQPPVFLQTLTASVFSLRWLRTESRQSPIRFKHVAMYCDRPGGMGRPRETLVPSRVQGVGHIGVAVAMATPVRYWLTAWAIQSSATPSGGTKTASNHSGGCGPDRCLAHRLWPNHYTKQRCTSKGFCSRSMW